MTAFASGFGDAFATMTAVGEFKLFQDRLRLAMTCPATDQRGSGALWFFRLCLEAYYTTNQV